MRPLTVCDGHNVPPTAPVCETTFEAFFSCEENPENRFITLHKVAYLLVITVM